MAVKIRLTRRGSINKPSYRLVATDTKSPRDGRFIEILGWYDPKRTGDNFKLDMDRVEYWLSKGAQLSETARNLVKKSAKNRTAETAKAGA